MRERCLALLDHTKKRLSYVSCLKPRLFVSDYFTSLRNEVDLETETRLIQLQDLTDGPADRKPTVQVDDDDAPEDWNDEVYNLARLSIIEELKAQESELIRTMKPAEEFELIIQEVNQLEEKVAIMEKTIQAGKKSPWSCLNKLASIYLEIENLYDAFKAKALSNRTFIFKPDFLNPLGALIIFTDHYLNEAEIMFIKYVDQNEPMATAPNHAVSSP